MKILIIRFSALGDIVMTSPVIRTVRKQYPNATIHFATKKIFKDAVIFNPYLDKVLLLDNSIWKLAAELKKEKYDLIIDIHKNIRSLIIKLSLSHIKSITFNKLAIEKRLFVARLMKKLPNKHIVDRYFESLAKIGVKDDGLGLDFFINDKVELSLKNKLPKEYIAFVVGANYYTRSFPIHQWNNLLQQLAKQNFALPIVLLGGKKEIEIGKEIHHLQIEILNYCGKLSIQESAYYLKNALLVVTNDTGLSHIACAFNKKMIFIWGSLVPEMGLFPFRVSHCEIFEVKNLPCRPCDTIGKHQCPKKHFRCMNEIDTHKMSQSILNLI